MKTLIIGEAPSKWMAERGITTPLPLARRELAALAGIVPARFEELFECANVLDEWPGKEGKGDRFPLEEARAAISHKMLSWCKHDRMILLGKRVAKAFMVEPILFQWQQHMFVQVCVAPHPSGVNAWWNKAENRRAAAIFWGSLVQGVPA